MIIQQAMDKTTIRNLITNAKKDKYGDLYVEVLGENNRIDLYIDDLLAGNIDLCIELIEDGTFSPHNTYIITKFIENTHVSTDDLLRLMKKLDKEYIYFIRSPITGLTIAHMIVSATHLTKRKVLIAYLIEECKMHPEIKSYKKTIGTTYYRGQELYYSFEPTLHEPTYSLLAWAVWHNDYDVVTYLLETANANPDVINFTVEDDSYYLSGPNFPTEKARIREDVWRAVEQAKKLKKDEDIIKMDVYKKLYFDTPLNAIFYDATNLTKFALQYVDVITNLFKDFDGKVFKLTDDEDIIEKRSKQLDNLVAKYVSLGREIFGKDILSNVNCSYYGLYPELHIALTHISNDISYKIWIMNLCVTFEGEISTDKFVVVLQDPYNKNAKQLIGLLPLLHSREVVIDRSALTEIVNRLPEFHSMV